MLPYKVSSGAERAKRLVRAQNGGQYQPIHGKTCVHECRTKRRLIYKITSQRDSIVSRSLASLLGLTIQGKANFSSTFHFKKGSALESISFSELLLIPPFKWLLVFSTKPSNPVLLYCS